MWCHLVNANKSPDRGCKSRENSSAKRDKYGDRGPQGRDNRARSAINLRPEDGYLQLV